MALHKLSRSKTFRVDYCGCTAAALLLNEQTIQDAIDFIHRTKTKRDFVKTILTVSKGDIKIIYNNEHKFSTTVPSTMIAGSAIGKFPIYDTIGVVYISPLTGDHYPAFVHVYRCDTTRTAQKILSRFRAYLLSEHHRLRLVQLEQQLLDRNLLNTDHTTSTKTHETNTRVSTASKNSDDNRQEKKNDPIKSITEELKKKIQSHEPILFPPKDYDTLHAAHGDIQRAQAWKSTEPTIVGYSPIDPDHSRTQRQLQTNSRSIIDERKNSDVNQNNIEKSHLPTPRRDAAVDPVETVSLAFDFLKDETSSIFTDNDGNIEHFQIQPPIKPPIYRFRPPQINAITKKIFARNNNYELTNGVQQSNSSARKDSDVFNNNNNNNNNHFIQNQHRARSETRLHYDEQPTMHLSPRYESRLVNGSGAPITTNPLWTDPSPSMVGSQPNLLSHQSLFDLTYPNHQLNPQVDRQMPSMPLQQSLYASYPDNKPGIMTRQQEHQHRRAITSQYQSNRKQTTQSQYLDTNEFILRASNGQPLRNTQHLNGQNGRDYRPHSMNVNGTMLDVYY